MDLRSGTHKPYMKPNNTPLYVHKDSNHPPTIIKNIPDSINNRLSAISSNEATFNTATPAYQQALNNSGYNYKLKYNPDKKTNNDNSTSKPKRQRKRNVTWFNPPFSNNVATNIGKEFLKLINRCFPPEHKLHKILNKNTIKVSYRTMPNIQQIISSHNKSLIRKTTPDDPSRNMCNCRKGKVCPLEGKCLESELIYQAVVTREDNSKIESYIGLTENQFKTRYNAHTIKYI